MANGSNSAIIWHVNDVPGGDLVHGTINSAGVYKAPATPPTPPMVSIKAVVQSNPSVKAVAIVVVVAQTISINVSTASASVQTGKTQNLSATVQNDTQNQGVTWGLSGPGCSGVACGTLSSGSSASGAPVIYTAPANPPSPPIVIATAQSVIDPGKSASVTITIANTPSTPNTVTIAVDPTIASVQTGHTQTVTATVQNDSQNKGVTWILSGAGCRGTSCGTLSATSSASGTPVTYTAPARIPSPATVILTAESVADLSKAASTTISLTSPPPPATIAVSVNPSAASVQVGKTQSLTATVLNDSQNKGVKWTLSGSGCAGATCGTLSATSTPSGVNVVYAAPSVVPSDATVNLTAQSVADSTQTAAATITVSSAPQTQSIAVAINPTTVLVQTGKTTSITATVENDTSHKGLKWELSGAGCSGPSCGKLSTATTISGAPVIYTAPNSVPSPAVVTVRARSAADTGKFASATIAITAVTTPPPPAVIAVFVNPTTALVQTGQSRNIVATVQNDSQNRGVTWSLSGAGCNGASCGTLSAAASASGAAITFTAPANAPSPAIVAAVATSVADPSKSASTTITITAITTPPPPAVIALSVNPTTASVQAGQTQNIAATVQNDSQNKGVSWSLSGAGCNGASCGSLSAANSASGTGIVYTAPNAVPSPATLAVTAASVADATKTAATTITITAPATGNVSVSVSPKRTGLTTGQTQQFTATVGGSGNTAVTWEVDTVTGGNGSVGTISANGTYSPPSNPGTHTIAARSVADTTVTATATVAITDLNGVFTYHNDLSRDGVNGQEYALNATTVRNATFGKRFSCAIDASAYAQPLWVANVGIGGGTHNVIVAATQHDTVYVFDADAAPCQTYWTQSLLGSGETWLNSGDVGTQDITPEIGIVGTPVIDPNTQTIYVVSKSKIGGTVHQRLHALNLSDGSEKFSGPAEIAFSAYGHNFDPLRENQRCGLALVNGVVYIAYASHGDNPTYYGLIVGYNASDLSLANVFNDDPISSYGGIWMSGGAPAADSSGNLYVISGNGDWDGIAQFGDSFMRLSTNGGIGVADYFTPNNENGLNSSDMDLGAGGAAILVDQSNRHLVIGGGKEGKLYLLNRDNLGGKSGGDKGALQSFSIGNGIFATAAFWQNTLYIAPINDHLKAFTFDNSGTLGPSAASQSPGGFAYPGSTPSISSQGSSNGIVWAIERQGAAVLHAYDATNLGTELWNSSNNSADQAGGAVKFTVPTVANGKVYVGTASEISVYGLSPN